MVATRKMDVQMEIMNETIREVMQQLIDLKIVVRKMMGIEHLVI